VWGSGSPHCAALDVAGGAWTMTRPREQKPLLTGYGKASVATSSERLGGQGRCSILRNEGDPSVTVPSGDDQARNIAILGPSYQSLMARYGSNFGTQWQVFALGLAAQGFVVGAASQVVDRIFTAVLLSVVILFIGAATIVSSLRIGLFTSLDRYKLDQYERVLLVGDFESLRLQHAATFREREERLPPSERPGINGSAFQRFVMLRVVRVFGPSLWWVVLELVISVAGAAIPILGIFRL
jgi:hypothetical protein